MARTQIKTAADHAKMVLSALAEIALETGATPEQIKDISGELTSSVKAQTETLDAITKACKHSDIKLSSADRLKYWGNRGVTMASVSKNDLKKAVTSKLNLLVASDTGVHPQDVVDSLSLVGEEPSTGILSSAIDEAMKAQAETKTPSRKDALKQAMFAPEVAKRSEERKRILASVSTQAKKKPTHVIVESLAKVGLTKEAAASNSSEAKQTVVRFVKAVSEKMGRKLAGITNVSVDGDKINIAISWDGDDSDVNLSVGDDKANELPSGLPEGDATGGGLDDLLGDV